MPAHRALALPDILHPTFSFMLVGSKGFNVRGNPAYRLAQVSRTFFEVAITFVWEDVDVEMLFSLIPLVWGFLRGRPRSKYELKADLDGFDPATWSDDQMSRFHFYGKFVKRLSFCPDNRPRALGSDHQLIHVLESQLGRLIMRYLEAHPVLLNLEALRVDSGKDESSLGWKMALVPRTSPLSKLYIVGRASQLPGDNKSEVERSLINSVIKRFPGLKIFELHSLHYALTPGVGKFPRLPIFNSLVDLRVTSVRVNHNTLDWASRLPSLQQLAIPRAYSAWFTSENIQPNRLYLFGALTVLRIDWDPHVATLLANCRFPSLIEFSLNCERLRGSFDSLELHSLASLISRHSPKIKTLKIRAHLCRDDNELVRYLGKYQTLQLSTLRLSIRLDEITIKFSDLNEVIAEHWPQLSHLAWEMRHLSLQEVAETIVCHPHLMSLAFDAMCGPWIKPVNVVSLASTLPLDLYCYIVDRQHMNAEEVARWLRDIRPGIRYDIYIKKQHNRMLPMGSRVVPDF